MKKLLACILALCMVLSLAACSGNPNPDAAATNGGGAAAPGNNAAASGEPKVVTVAFGENLTTLDPHDGNTTAMEMYSTMVFDSLMTTDHAGNYFPSLAESWEVSEDEMTYTFHIRPGVKTNTGETVDANDVGATFQRLLDNPTLVTASSFTSLAGVEVIDDLTVAITLNTTYGPALYSLSGIRIIPDEAFAKMGTSMFTEQKVEGSGPWVLVEWVDGQYIRFAKNPNYWDKENFDSYYDEVYLRFITEESSAISAQLSGDVNAYLRMSADLVSLYDGHDDIDVTYTDSGTMTYLQFQCGEDSPFNDPNVRRAFSMAIDRETIAATVMSGANIPMGFANNASMGHDPDYTSENYTYNPEKAKELLAASSYDGRELTILSQASVPNVQQMMLAICDYVNAIGFNVKCEIVETAVLSDVRATGDYDMFIVAALNPGGDPFHFTSFRIGMDMHHSNYVNPELNAMIDEALNSTDQAHRAELYTEINKIVCDEVAPMITLFQQTIICAIDKGVTGVNVYPDGVFTFNFIDYKP